MNAEMMQGPRFTIFGFLGECRELKTKEGKVWRTVAKIRTLGAVLEVTLSDASKGLFLGATAKFQQSAPCKVSGLIESDKMGLQLVLTDCEAVKL